MTTINNEEWWDDEQSYQGKEKNKETAENHLENLSQRINQIVNGKMIHLKIQNSKNIYDLYSNNLSKEDYQFYKDFYNNPISFYLGKSEKNSGRIKIKCTGTLLGTEKKYGNFFTKDKIIFRKYHGTIEIYFHETHITFDLGGSNTATISLIEFITKESVQILYEINRLIFPNFIPSMSSIKSEYSTYHPKTILIF
jgi:hypothetical protein